MRIALLLPNMRGGGAERVALALIDHFVADGHQVDLVLMKAQGELLPLVPHQVSAIDLGAGRIRNALGPLTGYLKRNEPDALLAFMWPLTAVAIVAHKLARQKGRLIVSDHIALSQQYRRGLQQLALRATTRLLYPLASSRVAVSEGAADDLARLSGLARRSITVIHNPLILPAEVKTTPEAEHLWGDADARILTLGTLKAQKNHALLLRAFSLLLRQRPRARLAIAGEGELRAALNRLASDLGISERVAMPGFQLDPWPYLASADLFVLSSEHEGFGNVLVEALHAGTAVVSTDCPSGPSEVLDGGRFGRLVPSGDPEALAAAMHAALDEPRDPSVGRGRAKALSQGNALDQYAELIGTVGCS